MACSSPNCRNPNCTTKFKGDRTEPLLPVSLLVTCHVQKDGRINLGTAGHKSKSCPALGGRKVHTISGAVIKSIPLCKVCYRK